MSWIWQRSPHSHSPLLCSPSSSILSFLSSREPGHAPALLRSSAAVFGKINGATGNGQGQKVTSAGARGRSVDVSTAHCTGCGRRDAEHTHMHTLSTELEGDRSLCVWLWPKKQQECGGTVSELWEVCMPRPAAQPRGSFAMCGGPPYIFSYGSTHKYPHTAHINGMLSMSNHTHRGSHFVQWHMTSLHATRSVSCQSWGAVVSHWCSTHPLEVPSDTVLSEEFSFFMSQSRTSRPRIYTQQHARASIVTQIFLMRIQMRIN